MNGNITELAYSDNPLERVKSALLTRIAAIEDFPPRQESDDGYRIRIEAFATAIAEIDRELSLERVLDNQIKAVVERVDAAFDKMEGVE